MMHLQLFPMSKLCLKLIFFSTAVKVYKSGEMGMKDALINFILVLVGSMFIGYIIGIICAYVMTN